MNSLLIIHEIFQMNEDILKSNSYTRLRFVLTEQLLLRIKDEDIKLRNESMLLFCYLDPNEIIPKLANKLIDSDEKVRAASEMALLNTLLKHKSNIDVIFIYIEYIRSINHQSYDKKIPINPGQINTIYTQNNETEYTKEQKEKLIERQFIVVKKWAKNLTVNSWVYIIDPLLKKIYASPEDQILVKFISTISEYLLDLSVIKIIFKQIIKWMIEQPKLTEELLNRNDEESNMIVKDILFLRISPLLILKVLSIKTFGLLDISKVYNPEHLEKNINSILNQTENENENENENEGKNKSDIEKVNDSGNENENEENNNILLLNNINDDEIAILLFKALIQRIEQLYEFDQVRKLSVEILANFPINYILPYIKYKLDEKRRTKDLLILKSYLYCICNMVIKHPIENLELTQFIEYAFHISLEILISNSKKLDIKDKSIQNIQMGCIECLSLIVCSFIRFKPNKFNEKKELIQEINISEINNNNNNNNNNDDNSSEQNIMNNNLKCQTEQVIYALIQLLNPYRQNQHNNETPNISNELKNYLPSSYMLIINLLLTIKNQSQPLIFEILSISIANIFTTTIHTIHEGIQNNNLTSTSIKNDKNANELNAIFTEKELEDILNVCINGLCCNKSEIRESSLKLFSNLLSCTFNANINTTPQNLSKINLNIINNDPISSSSSSLLNNNKTNQNSTLSVTHGLFTEGRHSLELIKIKNAIQNILENDKENLSSSTLTLAQKLTAIMNSY
ncbi:hypothetical protein BCR32DRAFT_246456 [Anaeromyces robustus]|uniref:Uncharacterized protein n=1 Tax=Anaeromyces robustus TaxID=1754192 RepID=A0A1Y1X0Q1_9FUNG|nr:hypothetical protein BCR32DRAFT_246456 [Anaeromyces robustus]|eukprot:ORX79370.1 hypothetical protein BCR32DRAFT_246456 [Anaeromyces robustus]